MIGQKLSDRYEILREIGRGGMGVVYLARDTLLGREVAVKVLAATAMTDTARHRFKSEARIFAAMDHPAIVSLFNIGEHQESLYLVMPFVHGENLRQILERGPLHDPIQVVEIGIQIAEALDHSHSRGVVHRDIKPENVIVTWTDAEPRVRITDFGLALTLDGDRYTRTGALAGTLGYLSPEQIERTLIDSRTDLYCVGTVLYECLVGRPPFTQDYPALLYSIVRELPEPLAALRPDLDRDLAVIVMQCLEKDRTRRPVSARELASSLMLIRERLTGAPAAAPASDGQTYSKGPTLFGRDEEMVRLTSRMERAQSGECQLVLVSGETGTGKSALIEHLRSTARDRGVIAVLGRFHERDRGFPFQGFCEAIQDFFARRDGLPDGTDFGDLATGLTSIFPVLAEIEALRHPTSVGLTLPAHTSNRNEIFELLGRVFRRIARVRPLLLLLDDLQSADVSVDALQYLVRWLRDAPILIVGTYRVPDVERGHPLLGMVDGLAGDRIFESIALGALSSEDIEKLTRAYLPDLDDFAPLVDRLADATSGNPFFLVELLRSLAEATTPATRSDDLTWLIDDRNPGAQLLPATIQQAIGKRIDHLPEPARRALKVASVIGRKFELGELEILAGANASLEGIIEDLINAGLLREEHSVRGDWYAFTSAVVRDALYASVPRRRRRAWHESYAIHLERKYAGRLERVYPQLVEHYAHAEVADRTVLYSLRLARKCLDAFAAGDAVEVLRLAGEFLDEDDRDVKPMAGRARRLRAEALRMLEDTDGAILELSRAATLLKDGCDDEELVRVCTLAAEIAWERRRLDEARKWIDRGIAAAADGSPDTDTIEKLFSLGETIANLRGDAELAREYHEKIEIIGARVHRSSRRSAGSGGIIRVPLTGTLIDLDPALSFTVTQGEVIPTIFESLTREAAGGRLVPWIAERFEILHDGQACRVELREDVRFHDGRRITTEDVRFTIERLLAHRGSELRHLFSIMKGAPAILSGDETSLRGFTAESDRAFTIEFERAVAFLPALFAVAAAGIVPQGTTSFVGNWSVGVLGTGPFRVSHFEPGRKLELEPNPYYWRERLPKCSALSFSFGVSPDEIREQFRDGRFSVAWDLFPADARRLRSDPVFAPNYREAPQLSTYFAAFNRWKGPLADSQARRSICEAFDVEAMVGATAGHQAIPANGLIPPGLLGGEPLPAPRSLEPVLPVVDGISLRVMLNSAYEGPYASLAQAFFDRLSALGFRVEVIESRTEYFSNQSQVLASADLVLTRWIADFPDAHDFVSLLHSTKGFLGRVCGSEDIDALIARGESEMDSELRHACYRRIESFVRDDAILLPMFHEQAYRFARPEVTEFEINFFSPIVAWERIWSQ